MHIKKIQETSVKGKKVLVRLDLDVPLTNGHIKDPVRLESGKPTIDWLLKNGASVFIIGHLGRPEPQNQESGIKNHAFSLKPVAYWLAKNFIGQVKEAKIGAFAGWQIRENLVLLENLRFYKEEKDPSTSLGHGFVKKLASLGELYVNDAFAVSHRNHASMVGVAKLLPAYAGLHLQKEIEVLSAVVEHPTRPLVVVVGGAKIETKLPLIEKMHHLADFVLAGGKLAEETKQLLKVQHERVHPLPDGQKSILFVGDLNEDKTDITEMTLANFLQVVQTAATVVWNGPMGFIEGNGKKGTEELAKAIVKTDAYSVIGGGDTIGFLKDLGILEKFSFVSTGGGAMLAFLSGEKLQPIELLKE